MMAQPTGSNMFGCFPLVVFVALLGFLAFAALRPTRVFNVPVTPFEATAEPAQSGGTAEGRQSLTVIEKVETQVSASMPATITMHLMGYQPDGCKFPVQVEQTRSGDSVTVKIFRIVPIDVMCTMDLNPYDDTITLDGTFESGTYTVDVNGTVVVVKV
jgi:hypothetical protein